MSEPEEKLRATLINFINATELQVNDEKIAKLLYFLQQLYKWNQAYNLSGIKKIEDMLTLHVLDSLVLAPFIEGELIADVGTGAGLPGLPLAIFYPEKSFILIDSNSKKTRFIFQTAALLAISNISIVHSRVEDYASIPQVDIVTSRAFASLNDFVVSCRHLVKPTGKFLAMKGQYPEAEIAKLPSDFQVAKVHSLKVPGINAERHVVDIRIDTQLV